MRFTPTGVEPGVHGNAPGEKEGRGPGMEWCGDLLGCTGKEWFFLVSICKR